MRFFIFFASRLLRGGRAPAPRLPQRAAGGAVARRAYALVPCYGSTGAGSGYPLHHAFATLGVVSLLSLTQKTNLMESVLSQALDRVQSAAAGGFWRRLFFAKGRYLRAMWFNKISYPRHKQPLYAKATTFWGGEMELMLPAGTDIYLLGGKSHESELRLARYMLAHLGTGDTFLDIGAHLGYFSLLAAHLVGQSGRVVAVEAATSTFAVLQRNFSSVQQAEALHACIAAQEGERIFYEFPPLYSEYNTLSAEQFDSSHWRVDNPPTATPVAALSISALCTKRQLQPRLIKIDVEGGEEEAIAGSLDWLRSLDPAARPVFMLEYLSQERQNAPHRAAVLMLQQLGYKLHTLQADGSTQPCDDIEAYLRAQQIDSDNIALIPF